VAGYDGGAALLETLDGGATWNKVYGQQSSAQIVDLGFTSPIQGVAIMRTETGGTLLMTFDAGRSWSPVSFRSA
jgi:photosystem II stability/assembly factor-like uncharacterized protein